MIHLGRYVSLAALVLFTAATVCLAQATAELNGRVSDESGAVLPGVAVTATQVETGFSRTAITDATGAYVMPNLPLGPYRLETSLQGFRTYVQTGIVLQVGASPTINVTLNLGNLEETVSVQGAAPIVDVRTAGVSTVVESEQILDLPLQGRQVTSLIVLAGAAVETTVASARSVSGGIGISVAGGQNFSVAYTLDGAMHNDPHNNLNLPMPFPDALQEFRVATGGLSAEHGMHSAASVSAVTKSGTNTLRGGAFDFIRDRRFNASSPFARVRPDGQRQDDGLHRHQFGGTLGGPIVRDRLFFFGGYQHTSNRQTPADNLAWVPTPAMLAGDFAAITSPQCNGGRQITLRAPFVNNRINPDLFDPVARNISAKLPGTTDPCGELRFALSTDSDNGQAVARADYQWSANRTLFGRYMATFEKLTAPYAESGNILHLGIVAGRDTLAQSLAIGDTTVFGSNMVNSLRFVFNRSAVTRGNPPWFEPHDVGSNVYSYAPGEMIITITGGFNVSAGTSATGDFRTNSYQVSDDLSLVRGRHQIGFGANVAYFKSRQLAHARSGGSWQFNGGLTGLGLADFMVGRVTSVEHGGPFDVQPSQLYVGTYAQDSWRATDRVTLSVGIRWEPFFGQSIQNGAISNFSLDRFRQGVKSSVYVNAPAGFLYPGDEGFRGGQRGINTKWLNVAPTAGLAWDVGGDGRTAARASYSLGYSFPSGEYQLVQTAQPPFSSQVRLLDPPGGLADPYRHLGGDPHPIRASRDVQFPNFGLYGAMDPDIDSPRTQNWNVTVEREIFRNWGVATSYLGSYADRLWYQQQLNPAVFLGLAPCVLHGVSYPVCTSTANINERRIMSLENFTEGRKIGTLDSVVAWGTQTYHGLRISGRRRAGSGVNVDANYTWAHCFGDPTSGTFLQPSGGYTDPNDPRADRGNCSTSRTHIANLSAGFETPRFNSAGLRLALSGWRISGIVNARSGDWLTVTTGVDGYIGQRLQDRRPNQVSDDVYGDKTLLNYLDRQAFAQPAPDQAIGNHERNSIKGPAFWTADLALSRAVRFTESQALELRLEAFNVFNHFNWGNPALNLNSGQFGRITTQAGTPRILQFGIKYAF